eukprot:4018130-Pyramimonas_sp.AAC.1
MGTGRHSASERCTRLRSSAGHSKFISSSWVSAQRRRGGSSRGSGGNVAPPTAGWALQGGDAWRSPRAPAPV